jgi:hypothetical protein
MMEELPLAVQLKLREMPGAETGVQVVDLLLEDGRVVPEVRVVDCTFAEEGNFEPEMVADVRLPAAPPSARRALFALLWLLLGILAVFWILWAITPESQRQ